MTSAGLTSAPVAADQFTYLAPAVTGVSPAAGSTARVLHAFDAGGGARCTGGPPAKTCAPLWTGTTKAQIEVASPVPAGTVVYVGGRDGNVYAFGLPQP